MPEMTGGIFYEHTHRMVATTVGMLTIVLALWLWRVEERSWMRHLGWAALGTVIAQGLLGGLTVIFLLPKPVSIAHACLAQIFFSTTVAIALFTSLAWRRVPEIVEDAGRFRELGLAAPLAVLAQLALGAAYRHKAIALAPHVAGAAVVTGLIVWIAYRALTEYPGHVALRRSSLWLALTALVQVFLGVAAYMSRVATAESPQPMLIMVSFTVLHVAVGALTMAASVVFGIQVFRNVARPASFARRSLTAAS